MKRGRRARIGVRLACVIGGALLGAFAGDGADARPDSAPGFPAGSVVAIDESGGLWVVKDGAVSDICDTVKGFDSLWAAAAGMDLVLGAHQELHIDTVTVIERRKGCGHLASRVVLPDLYMTGLAVGDGLWVSGYTWAGYSRIDLGWIGGVSVDGVTLTRIDAIAGEPIRIPSDYGFSDELHEIDAAGYLYVTGGHTNSIIAVASDGAVAGVVELASAGVRTISAVRIDARGHLWVAAWRSAPQGSVFVLLEVAMDRGVLREVTLPVNVSGAALAGLQSFSLAADGTFWVRRAWSGDPDDQRCNNGREQLLQLDDQGRVLQIVNTGCKPLYAIVAFPPAERGVGIRGTKGASSGGSGGGGCVVAAGSGCPSGWCIGAGALALCVLRWRRGRSRRRLSGC